MHVHASGNLPRCSFSETAGSGPCSPLRLMTARPSVRAGVLKRRGDGRAVSSAALLSADRSASTCFMRPLPCVLLCTAGKDQRLCFPCPILSTPKCVSGFRLRSLKRLACGVACRRGEGRRCAVTGHDASRSSIGFQPQRWRAVPWQVYRHVAFGE